MVFKTVCFFRAYSNLKSVSYFTTPIYYVNAKPHIGHLYSSVIADASQRWHKIRYKDAKIKFATGTDEHGTKIQQAAHLNKFEIGAYCNEISRLYRDCSNKFDIQYTDFVRTTDENHKATVHTFWNQLYKNGHIYESKYEGWYCVSDEAFLSEYQIKRHKQTDGKEIVVSSESGHPVEWTEEKNYKFKLSDFRMELEYWLKHNEKVVRPEKFYKILLDMIKNEEALSDVSVSRPKSRVQWGIPVPNDNSQTIYVWLDALVNYLTVAGYGVKSEEEFGQIWPPDLQVIGKDILKFHGVFWPAFLMAAGLEPPRSILCHSHWTVDNEKMSKSKGNVVDPVQRAEIYTADGLRYFLLREGVSHSDGNYSDKAVLDVLNSQLADTLGNLLSRCTGAALNPNQVIPEIDTSVFDKISELDVGRRLVDSAMSLPEICERHYQDLNFYKAVDSIMATLHVANLFFETMKPWELKKNPQLNAELNVVLHMTLETLRICGVLLQPVIPNISFYLLNKLEVPEAERFFDDLVKFSWYSKTFKTRKLRQSKDILFKRIILEQEKTIKKEKIKKTQK